MGSGKVRLPEISTGGRVHAKALFSHNKYAATGIVRARQSQAKLQQGNYAWGKLCPGGLPYAAKECPEWQ